MSAFQNIIDLRFAVSDTVGNRTISDVFPRLVSLAENDINTRLRTRWQIRDTVLTFDASEAALPPDFLDMIRIKGCGAGEYQVTSWAIVMPRAQGDRDAQYYARIPTLTCSPTACNWLLQRYPNVYLYGVALEAAKFLKDVDLATTTAGLYGDALRQLQIDDERARYSISKTRVRGLTP